MVQSDVPIDLHVHTVHGSADSSLKLDELSDEAARSGLRGLALTEHRGPWERLEFETVRDRYPDVLFVNGMEVETFYGHLTVFGLDRFVSGMHDPERLRGLADEHDAFVVLAHPFRYYLSQPERNLLFRDANTTERTVRELAGHPMFELADAIEVSNGGTSPAENALAVEVARYMGKPAVGGSDAHSTHGFGRSVTVFPKGVRTAADVLEALHTGRVSAALRDASGALHHIT